MFGLGVPELLFIMVLALLIFGPKRLPEVGKLLGRGMSEFRRATTELQRSINVELAQQEEPRRRPSAEPVATPSREPDESVQAPDSENPSA
jgi:TatA/E family protein of Tat protein translocase